VRRLVLFHCFCTDKYNHKEIVHVTGLIQYNLDLRLFATRLLIQALLILSG